MRLLITMALCLSFIASAVTAQQTDPQDTARIKADTALKAKIDAAIKARQEALARFQANEAARAQAAADAKAKADGRSAAIDALSNPSGKMDADKRKYEMAAFATFQQVAACQAAGLSFSKEDVERFRGVVRNLSNMMDLEKAVRDQIWNAAIDENKLADINVATCERDLKDLRNTVPDVFPLPTSPF